ncbi:MAG: beta-glucuronidase [Clostridia bacterium]|nr:beta-glucuronidase [Clostridia bacterium]
MGRLFEEHIKRQLKSLDGAWKFRTDINDIGKSEKWYLGLQNTETVIVPSVWNTQTGLLTYEGAAWYEKTFHTAGGNLRFCFGAVMTEAEVWLDGEYLGNHYGGFSQFDFIVSDVKEGIHRLTVRADNRFDSQSIPQKYVDWYHYGGIIRSVMVETLKGICILNSRFDYALSDNLKEADCTLNLRLYNSEDTEKTTKITAKLDSESVYCNEVSLPPRSEIMLNVPQFQVSDIRLWDIGSPNLYNICICSDTDDLYERTGFRKIEVKNQKILLNSKYIEIRGVNRHEEHPEFGFAFPKNLMKRDIDLALEMGCNAIRGSHYPNSKEFVDFLDERGILFWSEIPIWGNGFSEEALGNYVVVERGLNMHREMVEQYFNHPSIIMWGMHNEIKSQSKEAYAMTEKYCKFLKENGGNRLVVYASNKNTADICFEFSDVICLNEYFGWYGGEIDVWEDFLDKFIEHRNSSGFSDKPIIFSEFGAAALYGCHDDDNILWSEEYQAKLLSHCLNLFHNNPSVAGSFIWQFCDMRTCKEASLNRARGFNNKGILNEYRKPKLAYRMVKNLYLQFKTEESRER